MMVFVFAIISGCDNTKHSTQLSATVSTEKPKKPGTVVNEKVVGNKLITTTVTTSQKVEEYVPPPPVKKITITTGTETTSTLDGIPVKPDVQVHETPKVLSVPGSTPQPAGTQLPEPK